MLKLNFRSIFSGRGKDPRYQFTKKSRPQRTLDSKIDAGVIKYNPIFNFSYDGEKTPGAIGSIRRYFPDYTALRERAWQSFLESEITQTVLNKYITWVIGSGLRLQSEPMESELENLGLDREQFTKAVESKFKLTAGSRMSTENEKTNLHKQAKEALKNALLAGDCLVILRVRSGRVTSEIVDGARIQTPVLNRKLMRDVEARGNRVDRGVETDSRGREVAYFVRRDLKDYQRVQTKGTRTGSTMAFMVRGLQYRIESIRGIPLISAIMELLSKLERYREATVGSAEERQKIPYFIEHTNQSTGENPLRKNIAASLNLNRDLNQGGTGQRDAAQLANLIASTSQKQVYNMPPESTLKSLASSSELTFEGFYKPNVEFVCAAIEIPPEVALSKYDSNFSASRAALKDWENTLLVKREDFSFQFYKPYYALMLEVQVSIGLISAPGFLAARRRRDWMVVEAYLHCRFTGVGVPHIDPVKEVQAERAKLGPLGASAPLTTIERSTEVLNSGDFNSNIEKVTQELDKLPETPQTEPAPNPVPTDE